jgi:hypothetical protein
VRLQSAHFQTKEAAAPPTPKYVIPSFRKPPPSQEPPRWKFSHFLQGNPKAHSQAILPIPYEEEPPKHKFASFRRSEPPQSSIPYCKKEPTLPHFKNDLLPEREEIEEDEVIPALKRARIADQALDGEERPDLLQEEGKNHQLQQEEKNEQEEEEEDNKVVPPLEEQVMAFEPFPVNEDLLLVEKEEDHLLQQTTLYDVEDGKEGLEDSSILEEEYANLHEVAPQPMHVFTTVMEEINDEDSLLDELDALCSSIDVGSVSPVHEEHVP